MLEVDKTGGLPSLLVPLKSTILRLNSGTMNAGDTVILSTRETALVDDFSDPSYGA